MSTSKRLFFGFQVAAPWPHPLPQGRIVPENSRHLTLAFLGNQNYEMVREQLSSIPLPPFKIGITAFFDKCLFLPERHPNVVAWNGIWLHHTEIMNSYYERFINWLANVQIPVDAKDSWLCHTTIARKPFHKEEWLQTFHPLPFMITHLHLYESLPDLNYTPLWSCPLIAPFDEFEHTADIAYTIRGESLEELFYNAFSALSWRFPALLPFLPTMTDFHNLDDVIITLNESIGLADTEIGCPYKAISFHDDLKQTSGFLEWEMIVDV